MKIKSNCCCFGLGEEVHVLENDCPINRKEGKRSYVSKGKEINDCTCVYSSILSKEGNVSKCEYYNGVDYDEKSKNYFVNCTFK